MNNPCEDCRRACTDPCWKVDHGLLVEAPRWIPVTERLPDDDFPVLVHKSKFSEAYGNMETAYRHNGRWVGSIGETITHWMPLPEDPKEDDHG